MANLLASSSNSSGNKALYEVFINHRGPDTKLSIAGHLYNNLNNLGLQVFLDQEEMEKGDFFTSQIAAAIQAASIHIAIFSPGYADSEWCLNELLLMMESKESGRSTIIPIFYGVEPTDLRWTLGKDGVYAKALTKLKEKKTTDPQTHQEKPRYNSDIIENWRNALFRVSEISGFDLKGAYNGVEWQLVNEVVDLVLKKVKKPLLDVSRYPTGLDQKAKDFEELLKQQSGGARVLGIVGLGGVGKTTLAKEIFNRLRSKYKQSCFLFDIRVNSLQTLQSHLLKDLTQLNVQIRTSDEGKGILRKNLSSKEALIILDDVDHAEQLEALLLPAKDVLLSNSLILVTSRNKRLLINNDINESAIYECNQQHSQELFSLHAFGQPCPVKGFEDLVSKFLNACGELPLSLTVTGELLRGRNDLTIRTDELFKFSEILHPDIKSRLRISYESLHENDKQIFLDIACFFIGEDRDTAIRIWDGSDLYGRQGLLNLQNKCLIEVDSENHIRMHDHLRDLGRDIAENESPYRLCRLTDNFLDNLPEKLTVRGINMVETSIENRAELDNRFLGMRGLKLLRAEGDCLEKNIFKSGRSQALIWLRWDRCPHSCLPPWIPMERLRVLQVSGATTLKTLWGDHNLQAPLQLRELNIDANLSRIPKSIGELKHLEKFVLHLNEYRHAVDLKTLPEEFCYLQSLRHLELKKCSKLKSLPPSFGMLTDLKHFDLSGCSNLLMLPESLGKLQGLQYFNLSGCSNLEMLPDSLGNLMGLQHIDISGCSSLEMLPDSFGSLTGLQHIDLSQCSNLKMLPEIFGNLTNLQHLHFSRCSNLEMLPESLGELPGLQYFNLSGCSNLKWLPDSFGNLKDLQHIDISGCSSLKMLPNSLGNLTGLQHIDLSECSNLKMLPDIFGNLTNLQHLHLSRCSNLEMLPDSFGELTNLQHINLSQCSNLRKLPNSLRNLKNLRHIDLSKYPNLDSLPYSFGNLRNLQHINLSECSNLQMLPNSLENLKNLKHIDLSRCSKLQILPNFFGNLRNLQHIDLSWCSNLLMLPNSFGNLTNLQHVDLSWCSSLTTLPKSFGNLIQLKHLCLRKCYDLTISSETLGKIRTLEWIEISDCCGIEVLPPQVAHQRFLREMYLFCPFLKEFPGAMGELSNLVILHLSSSCLELLEIKALVSLEELRTRECVKLKCIQGLAQLTKLRRLEVTNCSELELLEIETLVSLEELTALDCVKLKRIQGLSQLTKLRRVIIDEKQL